jgi:hypothetical protein
LNYQFRNFWGGFAEVARDFDRLDDLDTRGGPPIVKPGVWAFYTGVWSDSRKTWLAQLNFNTQQDDQGGVSYSFNPFLRVRPTARLQAQFNANFQLGDDVAQWIKNTDVTGDGVDDSIYGRLHRNVVSVTTRGTFAFNRDMTIEAYLQPFVAVGDYTDVRRLAAPSSFDFESASLTTDPDFNNKSLRANIVFRWEYHKGSSLFVVWNRTTADDTRPGAYAPFRDLGDAFSGPGTNVFIVKLNYWLGL